MSLNIIWTDFWHSKNCIVLALFSLKIILYCVDTLKLLLYCIDTLKLLLYCIDTLKLLLYCIDTLKLLLYWHYKSKNGIVSTNLVWDCDNCSLCFRAETENLTLSSCTTARHLDGVWWLCGGDFWMKTIFKRDFRITTIFKWDFWTLTTIFKRFLNDNNILFVIFWKFLLCNE